MTIGKDRSEMIPIYIENCGNEVAENIEVHFFFLHSTCPFQNG